MWQVALLVATSLLVHSPMRAWDNHSPVLDDAAVAGRGHLDPALDFWGQRLCSPTSHGSWRPLVSALVLAQASTANACGIAPLALHRAATAALVTALVASVALVARNGAGVRVLAGGLAAAWLLSHPAAAESVGLVVGQADLVGGAAAALSVWVAVRSSRFQAWRAAAGAVAVTALALVSKESVALVPAAAAVGAEAASLGRAFLSGPTKRQRGLLAAARVLVVVGACGLLLAVRAVGRRAWCGWSASVAVFWPPSVNDVWLRPRLATRWLSLLERAAHHLSLLPGPALFVARVPLADAARLQYSEVTKLSRSPDWAVGSFPLVTEEELAAWSPRVAEAAVVLCVAGLAVLLAGALACTDARPMRGRALAAGLCGGVAALLPATGAALPVGLVVADRVALVPVVGLSIVLACLADRALDVWTRSRCVPSCGRHWMALAAVGIASAWLAHAAAEQQAALQGYSSWKEAASRAAVAAPFSGRPWLNLGVGQDAAGHVWPQADAQLHMLLGDAMAAADRVTAQRAAACASAALPGELFGSPSQVCRCARRLAQSHANPSIERAAAEALAAAGARVVQLRSAAASEFGLPSLQGVPWPCASGVAPARATTRMPLSAAELMLCAAAAQPCDATPLVAAGVWLMRDAPLLSSQAGRLAPSRLRAAALGSRLVRAGLKLANARFRSHPDLLLRDPGRPAAIATAAYSLAALRHAPAVARFAGSPAESSNPQSSLLAHMVAAHSLYGFAFDLLAAAGETGQLAELAAASSGSAVNQSVVLASPPADAAQAATAAVAHGQGRMLQCKLAAMRCAGGSSAAARVCRSLLTLCSAQA